MSVQSYYNRQIADLIISYVNEPSTSRSKLLGNKEKEEIADVFDACSDPCVQFEIGKTFECPLSLQYFEDPVITRCGHTFGSQFLYQSLEYKPECSFDRRLIGRDELRPNHLVTELTEKLNNLLKAKEKLIKVTLRLVDRGVKDWGANNDLTDPLASGCLLTEAVLLPCEHKFNIATVSTLIANETKKCPLDCIPFVSEIMRIDFGTSAKAAEVLKSIKHFNEAVVVQNIETFKHFDARFRLDNEIVKVIRLMHRCPLDKKQLLKDPVVSACGHTFERTNINDDSICPFDQSKISDLVPNYLVKSHLEMLHQYRPTYGFEIVSTRKVEDIPEDPDLEKAGLIFYAKPEMNFADLERMLKRVGLVTTMKQDTIWGRPLEDRWIGYVENFNQGTLQNFIDRFPAEQGICQNSKITLNIVNELTPQQYLDKTDGKTDED